MKIKIVRMGDKTEEYVGETYAGPRAGRPLYMLTEINGKPDGKFYQTSTIREVGARHFITKNSTYLFKTI